MIKPCSFEGCRKNARWRAIVIMPAPGPIIIGQAPMRAPSPLVVCDKHKPLTRAAQALGPNGYDLLRVVFKLMKKEAPLEDDLGLDWIEYSGGDLGYAQSLAPKTEPG